MKKLVNWENQDIMRYGVREGGDAQLMQYLESVLIRMRFWDWGVISRTRIIAFMEVALILNDLQQDAIMRYVRSVPLCCLSVLLDIVHRHFCK